MSRSSRGRHPPARPCETGDGVEEVGVEVVASVVAEAEVEVDEKVEG